MTAISARAAEPARRGHHHAQAVDRHVAMRLRERRLLLGLTQHQVAERIGSIYQQVYKYEAGVSLLSAGRLHQLAAALEVEVGYFFAGLEPPAEAEETPAPAERQRALLGLARGFARLPGRAHQQALCALARALAEAEAR